MGPGGVSMIVTNRIKIVPSSENRTVRSHKHINCSTLAGGLVFSPVMLRIFILSRIMSRLAISKDLCNSQLFLDLVLHVMRGVKVLAYWLIAIIQTNERHSLPATC